MASTVRGKNVTVTARLILVGQAVVTLAACATPPREYTDPRPVPTAEQRAAFGTIGIAAAGLASPRKPDAPKSRSHLEKAGVTAGAGAVGAGTGAIIGLTCGPVALICVPVFAAAGGFAGLASGMAETLPYGTEEQVNSADITLRNSLLSVDVEARLVETVLAQASRNPSLDLRRVDGTREDDAPEHRAIDGRVDTRILLAAPEVSLVTVHPNQTANPDVRLEIVVDGKIFDGHRETPRFERRWRYDSEVRGYFDWADDRGALVVAEVHRAIAVLGTRIAADFLGEHDQTTQRPSVGAQAVAAPAALGEAGGKAPPLAGTAPVEAKVSHGGKLRAAIFPFAGGVNPGYVAESELVARTRHFIAGHRDMELIYSAYDEDFDHSALGPASRFWRGGYASKSPEETHVYRAAKSLDAHVVFTYFFQKRTPGHYSDDLYRFELYLLDVRQGRWYRVSGDERSVSEGLESILWLYEAGRAAS